jgi:tetratricopeptide (TPR) repeat protein
MSLHSGPRLLLATLCTAAVFASVLQAVPQSGEPEIQIQLGDLLSREARFEQAAAAYRRARDASTGDTRMRAGRALVRTLLRTPEFRRARAEAELLLAERPNDAEALALHGDSLWAGGLFEEAEGRYHDAVAADPRSPRAHNGLAKSLAARTQLAAALDEAGTAVDLAPREADFRHTLGFVYERLCRYDEAAAAFSEFVRLLGEDDRSDRTLWTRQQIRFLRSFGDRRPLAMRWDVERSVHTVPFRLVRDKVVVRGSINGSRHIDLVLDTGAELAVVTKRTAEQLGIDPIVYTLSAGVGQLGLRSLQVGRLDSLEVGSLRVEHVPALIKNPPLRDLPTSEADSFSPLAFGLSVNVDYGRRLLTMGRALPEVPADTVLPLRLHRLALVRGLVNNASPVHFVVDTGGEVISISRATFDAIKTEPSRRIPLRVYGTSGWDPDAFLMPGLDVAFAQVRLPKLAVVVLNLDAPSALLGFEVGGIVGHKFLSQYNVRIDLANSQLRLTAL